MTNGKKFATPYDLDGRIPLRQAIPLGLQHVLAMFVGNLSPLLIIMATCKLTDGNGFGDLRISLIQNAMIIAGLITFLQLYPIGRPEPLRQTRTPASLLTARSWARALSAASLRWASVS